MRNFFYGISILILAALLAASCNIGNDKGKAGNKDSAEKTVITASEKTNINKPSVILGHSVTMNELLTHFKISNDFPIVVDSAYMNNINKQDSLGTSEVKMLVKKWAKDSLLIYEEFGLSYFYMIDSLKAGNTYKQWLGNGGIDFSSPIRSNAYGLQKISLTDGTMLLVWALEYSDGCDPLYTDININCTIFYNSEIRKTFLLGYDDNAVDPPAARQVILSSVLTNDGKLTMEMNDRNYEDIENRDTSTCELNHTHYEYLIKDGNILLKAKQQDATKDIHRAVK